MPSLDLRDPQLRARSGLVTDNRQPIPSASARNAYHRPLSETRKLIMQAVRDAPCALTRSEIAAAICRKKSKHLTDIVQSLVLDGLLIEQAIPYRAHVMMYVYTAVK